MPAQEGDAGPVTLSQKPQLEPSGLGTPEPGCLREAGPAPPAGVRARRRGHGPTGTRPHGHTGEAEGSPGAAPARTGHCEHEASAIDPPIHSVAVNTQPLRPGLLCSP